MELQSKTEKVHSMFDLNAILKRYVQFRNEQFKLCRLHYELSRTLGFLQLQYVAHKNSQKRMKERKNERNYLFYKITRKIFTIVELQNKNEEKHSKFDFNGKIH